VAGHDKSDFAEAPLDAHRPARGLRRLCGRDHHRGAQPHATYAAYLSQGCIAHPYAVSCESLAISLDVDPFSAMFIVLQVLPVLIGVFVGAPLLARELETGTFRFTWTQAVGRARHVLTTFALLAASVALGTLVLGLLLNWYAHPFDVIGVESQWQSGQFDTTGPMLAAWALSALGVGTLIGAVIGRTVAAMAVASGALSGLLVLAFAWLVARLESVGTLSTNRLAPMGLGIGHIGLPGAQYGLKASWLVRAWITTASGHVLSPAAAAEVIARLYDGPVNRKVDPSRWLSAHHYLYWVSYQPAGHFWIFQLVAVVVLVALGALAAFATIAIVSRRA
jgi:hypothetical protein